MSNLKRMYDKYYDTSVNKIQNDFDNDDITENEANEKFSNIESYEEFCDGYAEAHEHDND